MNNHTIIINFGLEMNLLQIFKFQPLTIPQNQNKLLSNPKGFFQLELQNIIHAHLNVH